MLDAKAETLVGRGRGGFPTPATIREVIRSNAEHYRLMQERLERLDGLLAENPAIEEALDLIRQLGM